MKVLAFVSVHTNKLDDKENGSDYRVRLSSNNKLIPKVNIKKDITKILIHVHNECDCVYDHLHLLDNICQLINGPTPHVMVTFSTSCKPRWVARQNAIMYIKFN